MGKLKQLHIDCEEDACSAGDFDNCYIQPDNGGGLLTDNAMPQGNL